ncbi:hypothetical protein ONS95_003655 [Cadophora gregata]|uniref:uncharacterized protein n=1 Tax=Cadophora gregata TaxID=51156 RepID=UPI0026DAF07B|nr:uncharacterized protein ONS95_003655 [Cadophora gregata]KAK0106940.1 hypothetical protein ONS95_003655 [Cadophora gregata]
MTGGIPQGAVGVSVIVLLYSAGCLTLTTLLTCLLVSFGEAWSYVTIFSGFTALSTFASLIQQIHYAAAWEVIKEAQFHKAVESQTRKGLAFGGAAQIVDQVLFYIQFYSYNVMALNVFFWTVALFAGAWELRSNWLGEWQHRMAPVSKVFSVLFPILVIGLMQIESLQKEPSAFIIVTYFAMFTSLSMGSILLVLILYKYMKTRRLVAGHSQRRGRWWASDGSKSRTDESAYAEGTVDTAISGTLSSTRRSIYDRALITRFTIGFVILALFEITIIIFTLFQASNNASIAAAGKPDFSVSGSIVDIVLFIPGVTASLVAFLVFGTTKSWRQYRDLVVGGCGLRRKIVHRKQQRDEEASRPQGLEFERLPSLQKSASEEQRKAVQESENRVRMFARELNHNTEPAAESSTPPKAHLRSPSNTRVPQFHRPMPPRTESSLTSGLIEVGISIAPGNQVVQYDSPNSKKMQPQESIAERSYEFYHDVLHSGSYIWRIRSLHAQYGPIIRISPNCIHINDPNFYDIYSGRVGERRNKYPWSVTHFACPQSIIATVDHDHHRLRRSAVSRYFAKSNIRAIEPELKKHVEKFMERMKEFEGKGNGRWGKGETGFGEPVNIWNAFKALASDVVTGCAFGESHDFLSIPDFNAGFWNVFTDAVRMDALTNHWPWFLPLLMSLPEFVREGMGMGYMLVFEKKSRNQLKRMVANRELEEKGTKTIFGDVLRSNLPAAEKSVDRMWHDGQVFNVAGSETTSWTLVNCIVYLLSNPEIMTSLREELKTVLKDGTITGVTVAELEALPYLTAVLKESLRLSYGISGRLYRISPDKAQVFNDGTRDWILPAGVCSLNFHSP